MSQFNGNATSTSNIDVKVVADSRSSTNAFTLVELSVVIGIIAILIGLLSPSLQRARAASKKRCLLGQSSPAGAGFCNYAQENRNWWPMPAAPTQNPPGYTGSGMVGTYWSRDFIYPLLNRKTVPTDQYVNNTFIKNSVFECPSADKTQSGLQYMPAAIGADDQQQWGYGMSARLNDYTLPASGDHAAINGTKIKYKSVSKIHKSAETCLLIDRNKIGPVRGRFTRKRHCLLRLQSKGRFTRWCRVQDFTT